MDLPQVWQRKLSPVSPVILTAPCISLDPYCQDVVQLATDTHRLCIGFLSSVILKIESWVDMSNIGHQTLVELKIHGHVPYFGCSYWYVRMASAGRQCLLIALDRLLLQLGRN